MLRLALGPPQVLQLIACGSQGTIGIAGGTECEPDGLPEAGQRLADKNGVFDVSD
jgi:hypothetical protein